MADGQVVFEITADGKHIKADIKEITKAIEAEGKNWDKAAGQSTKGIEDAFGNMASGIVAKLTAAGIGAILLNWGTAAVETASDLAEVQNVVDTVFGDGSRQIEAWAKKAGTQFGLTELQAKKFTSTLGAMMKSSGLAGDEIVSMTTDLSGLAADMASFYNLDFEEAFDKIRSGISGQTMPLKTLGIDMSVANLNAYALAQGLGKTFEQMDQGEQVMLRYQYLMQATSDAQGDFAKTADGFANAQRRIQTALTTIESVAGGFILNAIEPLISKTAEFLEKITATPERTVLDDFNDIDVDTSAKMADLNETYNKASDIISLIDEINKQTVTLQNGSTVTFEELFKDLGNVEANGGDVRGYLESLGVDVEEVIQKYNIWKESTRQLTSLVPSLTGVINSETGAIDGGTEALQKNLDEWKAYQEKKIAWAAYYAKKQALAEAEGSVWQLRLDAMGKEQTKKRIRRELEEIGTVFTEAGKIDTSVALFDPSKVAEDFDINDYIDKAAEYEEAVNAEEQATLKWTKAVESNAQAHQELDDIHTGLIELYGEEEEAAEDAAGAVSDWSDETKKAGKEAVAATEEALKALADYVQGVKDSTAQAVNSVLKGFDKIGKAGDDLRKKQEELGGEFVKTEKEHDEAVKGLRKKYGENWLEEAYRNYESLTDAEKDAYNALAKIRNEQNEVNQALNEYSPEGMKAGLESQIEYMREYLNNLHKLQDMGISADFLASLSDGSKESAEYLANLAAAGPEAVEEVSALYDEVQAQKKSFTDALADQKLAADETYDALVEKALEAVNSMSLGGEAEQAMADTVDGLARGIYDKVPEVKSAVDAIEEQLNRLSTFGLNFNFGIDGFEFGHLLDGEHETGLDYVPFDGYLAGLHEGEGILTAEENRIWQRFKNNQGTGVDYDALGNVMRDNVHAGGNVYLDGRAVGQVVSGIQGNQYRSLQRSGWQG